jgi:hypothetical protein
MKLTLLRVVQDASRYLQGFDVDSIFDTQESEDIAYIAEREYYHLVQRFNNIGWTGGVGTLESVSDTDRPNYLRIPDNVQRIQHSRIQYNAATADETATVRYTEVRYLEPQEFLSLMAGRTDALPNTQVVNDPSGVEFVIRTDKAPEYCTSFDQEFLVFDSYNSDADTTLQQTKSRVEFTSEEVFLLQDDFIIPIPADLSTLYQDMVTSAASMQLRQEPAQELMRRSRAALIRMQQKNTVGSQGRKMTYGRNGPRYTARKSFPKYYR